MKPLQKLLCIRILLVLLLTAPFPSFGSWYDQKLEGWYYFQGQKHIEDEKTTPGTLEEADNYLATESRKLKQLLSFALVSPTHENVEKYIRAQRRWMEQSGRFAQMWGKVLLEHPDLSDLLTTPTSSFGVLTKRENDLHRRKELLQALSRDYFLLFFFKGADRYSQKATEVAQLFASTNNWKLKAVSLDKLGNSELQNFEIDKGISEHLNVQVTPSFYIVNPTENQVYPVGIGMISVSEIEENIEKQLKGFNDEHKKR